MKNIIFITGGSRSGKSRFALEKANSFSGKKVYIATAEPLDEEMRERIERHKKERGREWFTMEEPLKLAELIRELKGQYDVILLDCLTLWLSNLMMADKEVSGEIEEFIATLKKLKDSPAFSLRPSAFFIVSNEVGMGIVPENELARKFRDMAGLLNQRVAELADEVYLMVSGIPVKIRGY